MIAAALSILGTVSGAFQYLQDLPMKFSWYITHFFTASVSINSRDRLNLEVLNWVSAQVLARQNPRIVTAYSHELDSDAFHYQPPDAEDSEDEEDGGTPKGNSLGEKSRPIQYLPAFESTWFFHDGNIFIVRLVTSYGRGYFTSSPNEFASAPLGKEPLIGMCLGRSVKPIKRLMLTCRESVDEQREAYVTVRMCCPERYQESRWDTTILRTERPFETIHFDEKVNAELVADIRNYLNPARRRFYSQRGIPYQRGQCCKFPMFVVSN